MSAHILFLKAPTAAQATPAQLAAGNYRKKHIAFLGLAISIENPKGSVRSGTDRDGHQWRTEMRYDYGYVRGTKGVDGDHVDCYVGPNKEATHAYIVHQRKAGNWKDFDEDKVMLGFDSEEDAKQAYLLHYDDPRFLGPITAMPMEEFKAKVLATKDRPRMIKAQPRALFFKSYVRAHSRRLSSGKVVQVGSYHNSVSAKPKVESGRDDRTGDLFGGQQEKQDDKEDVKPRKFYVTMVRDRKQVAWLAGPFDTHEEALAQVDAAREAAYEVDPWSHFDAFGTASFESDNHPPGKLNDMLGIGRDDAMKDYGESRKHGVLRDYINRGDLKGALDWLNTASRKEIEESALYAGLSVTWFKNHKDRMAWFSRQIADAIKRNTEKDKAATA